MTCVISACGLKLAQKLNYSHRRRHALTNLNAFYIKMKFVSHNKDRIFTVNAD